MRKTIILLAGLLLVAKVSMAEPIRSAGTIDVCFTPGENCTEKIVKEISGARKEILVQAYSFTSVPIAKALLAANKRGVAITAVLDISNRKKTNGKRSYSAATFLNNAKIPTFIDDKHAIAHNKIMVIDRSTLITGSFNFTKAAEEKNAENLLIIKSNQILTNKYVNNFAIHLQHSVSY